MKNEIETDAPSIISSPAAGLERHRAGDRVTIFRNLRDSPSWYAQFNSHGRQYRPSLKTKSKKRAMEKAKKIDAELVLGLGDGGNTRAVNISEAIEKFFASLRDRGRSERTLRVYANDLKQFAAWAMERGIRRLDQLTVDVLEKYHRQLADEGYRPDQSPPRKGYTYKDTANKPHTLKNKMTVIRQLIRFAVKRAMINKDPAPGYYLPSPVKLQAYCYTAEDLRGLFDAIGTDNVAHRDIFDFLRLTGLRSDELCWLLKDDIALDRACMSIRPKECPQTRKRWRPKRGNARTVPLCPLALEIAKRAAASSPGPWLFWALGTTSIQKGHWRPDTLWRLLKRYKKTAKLTHGTIHTFRHVFCSFLANKNVSPFQVMKIMGHQSLKIVLTYYHVNEQDLLEAVSSLPFDQMFAPTPAKKGAEVVANAA